MTKYIFVTGGVISGLGKGITSASIGALLKEMGYSIAIIKCDPYLNIDPGTQNPFQHGETYVTHDGMECDLDLGHYERFLNSETCRMSNMTSGQVYETILGKERRGDFQGQTVQVVPHVTEEIQKRIIRLGVNKKSDIVICEIGGTVGDIESLPFLEAIRQMQKKVGRDNCCYVHLSYVPYIASSGEVKTKPTQHSVKELRSIGITPDIIICRTSKEVDFTSELKNKISIFCDVDVQDVIEGNDVIDIYEVPINYHNQQVHLRICDHLKLDKNIECNMSKWESYINKKCKGEVKIGIVGKYIGCQDAYKSIEESLKHAAKENEVNLIISKIDAENIPETKMNDITSCDGILVPGGFGQRGFEGKVDVAGMAYNLKIPYFGICLGMQAAVVAAARRSPMITDANSTEFDKNCINPVINLMEEQKEITDMGGTMRLGDYECYFLGVRDDNIAFRAYDDDCLFDGVFEYEFSAVERHRHRYEFNDEYESILNTDVCGIMICGRDKKTELVEIIQGMNHPWYIGVQFHPEFKSSPLKPHPLFVDFIRSAKENRSKKNEE